MTQREILLYSLILGFEILLCVLIYLRNLQRRLPFFTAHATLLLAGTLGLRFVYHHFGFRSYASYDAAWTIAAVIIIARFLAIAELCHYELRAYQGIWALTWRILALLAVFFLGHAAVDTWGQVGGFAIWGLTIERDIAITSIVILLAMLLIRNYYALPLEPLHMWIAIGMCIVLIIDVMNNSVLHRAFTGRLFSWFFGRYESSWSDTMRSQVEHVNDMWNLIRTSGLVTSLGIWCYALRKPLPAPVKVPDLLPAEVYGALSPAVNLRLRAFNDRLQEMLKP
jgi:hypothetical protein